MTDPKNYCFDRVAARRGDLSDWNQLIWHYGETAWREYKSAAWYVARLRAEGFAVEEGSGGMPTAFVATWSNGPGPTVGAYAEYDAVPGNCQKAAAYKAPRDGLSRHAGGHTDPHSALGIGALGGVLAAKAAMERFGIPGRLTFFGEPAEKVRGSKPIHATLGYYDDVDAFISFHPCYMLPLSNTVRWNTHCGAGYAKIYSFECDEPETWLAAGEGAAIPAAHATARAPGANEALFRMFSGVKHARESMLPNAGGWSLNEAILVAGQATADNLAPQLAQIQYIWRTPDLAMAEIIDRVLDRNAEAAAAATHCRVVRHWVSKSRPGLPNHALARATYANLELAGAPQFGPEAVRVAQEIQRNLGIEPMAAPFDEACSTPIDPEEAERRLRQQLPPWQENFTSDDYTEMCWHAPTVRLYIGRPMLKAPAGYRYPDWAMNALGGIRATIDPMIVSASRTVAATIVDLLTDADLLERAKAEFVERTGGGIGGGDWIAPLCDYPPPIDFRWPEYVTTPRGEEWWIPTTAADRR